MSTVPRPPAKLSRILSALVLLSPAQHLYSQNTPEQASQKIQEKYALTKTTASKDDIVTAGAVLVLSKDGLVMSAVGSNAEAQDNYKGGKLSPSSGTKMLLLGGKCSFCPHNADAPKFRTFVAGEKFWITSVETKDDGIVLDFFSDPISDVRYIGQLKFPFANGGSADELMTRIGEVIKVQPSDDAKTPAAPPATPAVPAAAAPVQAMAPIAPPPPPVDAPPPAPKTVSVGQTRDEVIAIFGQPTKIAKLPTKEIDYYPDIKVTYVNNKVKDVQ